MIHWVSTDLSIRGWFILYSGDIDYLIGGILVVLRLLVKPFSGWILWNYYFPIMFTVSSNGDDIVRSISRSMVVRLGFDGG